MSFFLTNSKPARRSSFNFEVNSHGNSKLKNVHLSILHKPLKGFKAKSVPSSNALDIPDNFLDVEVSACKPHFFYFHYLQDNEKDEGWGCAYRSLQTLFSWFLLQGLTSKAVPSILEIQKILVAMGDKEKSFIQSREWIGAFEVSFVIQKQLGFACNIQHISSGAQVSSLLPVFENHFRTVGSPIMIGGGVLAYTLLGLLFVI